MIGYSFLTAVCLIRNSMQYRNGINPLFWSGVIVYIVWHRKNHDMRMTRKFQYVRYIAMILGLQLIGYLGISKIKGTCPNCYEGNILANLVSIIGLEMARNVLVIRNRNNKMGLIVITIVCILVQIRYDKFISLYLYPELFFQYICGTILPLIASNSLYTYLTLQGSYKVVMFYRICCELVLWGMPELPNIDWFISGTTGILIPLCMYVLWKYKFDKPKREMHMSKQNRKSKISFIITLLLSSTFVCFMAGAFQYEPITILSNSMEPQFNRGDVVVYKKLQEKELKQIPLNSIIVYHIGEQNIAHRIVEKIETKEGVKYRTKGDRNYLPDTNLVSIEQIKGVYAIRTKYAGFPAVWLYEYFRAHEIKVETQ